MGIEFTLFVHGVPKGQKIWGPNEDRDFIGLYYGKYKDKPNNVLSVEINGGNSYYTYLVSRNVLANDGRSGSYFALTLRVNRYYADVKNIYNLLDAAYNKFILNKIVKDNGTSINYLIEDFNQENGYLQGLEKEIINYLNQFSSNADILPLSGFPEKVISVDELSLLDCDHNKVAQLIKTKGAVLISPNFQSIEVKAIANKKEVEKAQIKNDYQNTIKNIRVEYSEMEKSVSKLKQDLSFEREKCNGLRISLEKSNDRVSELEKLNRNGKQFQDELKRQNDKLEKVGRVIPKISEAAKELASVVSGGVTFGLKEETSRKQANQRKFKVNSLISFAVSLLNTILLIVVLIFLMPKSCSDKKLGWLAEDQVAIQDSLGNKLIETQKDLDELKAFSDCVLKGFHIDVSKFSKTTKHLKKGEKTKLSLLDDGKFEVEQGAGLEITGKNNDEMEAKNVGKFKVFYVIGDKKIASREIEVKE